MKDIFNHEKKMEKKPRSLRDKLKKKIWQGNYTLSNEGKINNEDI